MLNDFAGERWHNDPIPTPVPRGRRFGVCMTHLVFGPPAIGAVVVFNGWRPVLYLSCWRWEILIGWGDD